MEEKYHEGKSEVWWSPVPSKNWFWLYHRHMVALHSHPFLELDIGRGINLVNEMCIQVTFVIYERKL